MGLLIYYVPAPRGREEVIFTLLLGEVLAEEDREWGFARKSSANNMNDPIIRAA